jgi:hypothetical protein
MSVPQKKHRLPWILLIGILLGQGSIEIFAQKEFKMPETREVIVIQGDSTIKAHLLYASEKKVKRQAGMTYHWYAANTIRQNEGDFDGKLLSGPYKIFDKQSNLILKGELKNGLKHGKWTSWYTNGKIKHEEHWKKGRLHGHFTSYSLAGKVTDRREYKKGELLPAVEPKVKKAKVKAEREKKEHHTEEKVQRKWWSLKKSDDTKEEENDRGKIDSSGKKKTEKEKKNEGKKTAKKKEKATKSTGKQQKRTKKEEKTKKETKREKHKNQD